MISSPFRFGKSLELRKFGKRGMGMTIILWNLNDRMKVGEFLFDILWRSLENGVRYVGPSIQFAAHHSQIELGTGIASDKFRFLKAEKPGK